jgi:hypothetical protein
MVNLQNMSLYEHGEPKNGILFGKRTFWDVTRLKISRWDNPGLQKWPDIQWQVFFYKETHETTQRRGKVTTKIVVTQWRKPKNACSHQKLEEARKDSSLWLLETVQSCRSLDFILVSCRTLKEYISVWTSAFVVICHGSLRKLRSIDTLQLLFLSL